MLKRVKSGKTKGILVWYPDRLACNSAIDSGKKLFIF
jgi:hypothetical protein